jgi:hypothetical protein
LARRQGRQGVAGSWSSRPGLDGRDRLPCAKRRKGRAFSRATQLGWHCAARRAIAIPTQLTLPRADRRHLQPIHVTESTNHLQTCRVPLFRRS